MKPSPIKQFFPEVLNRIGINPKNFSILSLVERELSCFNGKVQIVGYRNNAVYIEVDSSSHFHELLFKKKEIQKTLQGIFPSNGDCPVPELKIFLKGTARSKFKRAVPAVK